MYRVRGLAGPWSPTLNTEADLIGYCSQGRVNWLTASGCWARSLADWQSMATVAPSIMSVPPAAPQTAGAMTVQGVWTPDYAIQRTQGNVQTEQQMTAAAADARNLTGPYAGGQGLPFGNPDAPDVNACDSVLYQLLNMSECGGLGFKFPWGMVAVVGVVGVLALVAIGGGSPRRYGR